MILFGYSWSRLQLLPVRVKDSKADKAAEGTETGLREKQSLKKINNDIDD